MAAYTIDKIEYDSNVYNLQDNVSGYITGISSSDVTTALGFTPYNSTNPSGYTTNTGTVTKVTAGTGLAIGSTAQGNFTTSGTINHTNSVTAQTTQAIYPIKIDAQGHISAYGTAVTPLTASSTLDATKLSGTIPSGCYTDTKNTAGSTDSSSKLFLIGATSQATNPQTYSQDTAYVGTDGCLYSGGQKTLVDNYSYSAAGGGSTSIQITPLTNEYGSSINIGALDSIHTNALSLNIGSTSISFFDLIQETQYIGIYSISDYPNGNVFIYGLPTPTENNQAANKKYVDDNNFKSTTASLTTSGWSSNSKTVSVTGVTASNTVIVSPAPASYDAYCEAGVYCSAQGAGTLTFTCDITPSAALTVNILYK